MTQEFEEFTSRTSLMKNSSEVKNNARITQNQSNKYLLMSIQACVDQAHFVNKCIRHYHVIPGYTSKHYIAKLTTKFNNQIMVIIAMNDV